MLLFCWSSLLDLAVPTGSMNLRSELQIRIIGSNKIFYTNV